MRDSKHSRSIATSSYRQSADRVISLASYRAAKARRSSDEVQKERARAEAEADGVLAFFEGDAPGFLIDAVVDGIVEACDRLGFEPPTYDENEPTRALLIGLFIQTNLLSLRMRELA